MGRGTLAVYVCVMVASDKIKIGGPVEILETLALACAEQRRASANMAASETENPARRRVFIGRILQSQLAAEELSGLDHLKEAVWSVTA